MSISSDCGEGTGMVKKRWKRHWVKLWIETLDDPKLGKLPDWLWRRAIELFLLAGENGNDGLLQPVRDMAWRLRTSEGKLTEALTALARDGVVHETPEGWLVASFARYQESESSTERSRRWRATNKLQDENEEGTGGDGDDSLSTSPSLSLSSSSSVSPSDSADEGSEFVSLFGEFRGARERKRWRALVERVGAERAREVAEWAERKEVHRLNRGGLMDSLETAAKRWSETSLTTSPGDWSSPHRPCPLREEPSGTFGGSPPPNSHPSDSCRWDCLRRPDAAAACASHLGEDGVLVTHGSDTAAARRQRRALESIRRGVEMAFGGEDGKGRDDTTDPG
jgi:hypothetical protein